MTGEQPVQHPAPPCLSARRSAPSAVRNRDPIVQVLRRYLPHNGRVLEIASGTGEHALHVAQHLGADLEIQPSDPSPEARASIDAWAREAGLPNLRDALDIDVCAPDWWVQGVPAGLDVRARLAVILCINMIHISPWQATVGLVTGAGHLLGDGGLLILYGPYRRGGTHTAPSNEAFDLDLRSRNPAWGVRDLEDVAALAVAHGFSAPIAEDMPANNLTVIFKRVS
ncbi:MAG: DUF938 domain-containing protein [Hyphomicrobium sp.]